MSKIPVSHPVSRPLPVPGPSAAHQLLVPLLALLIILCATFLATTAVGSLYAAPSGSILYAAPTGTGDCLTWANACTLQTALTSAVATDEIWVQAGAHKPTTANDRTATFTLANGVAVYGGFAGTETLRTERDHVANVTVLSGDIDNNDIVDANGVVTSTVNIAGFNSYHVVTGSSTDSSALLDGVTVTAGAADSPAPHKAGGGMVNNNGSPTLSNVIFSGNLAGEGGGMTNDNGSPALTNVTFNANSTGEYFCCGHSGGGMLNRNGSSPSLTNVTFSANSATNWWGGGMYNASSSPMLSNVTFNGNSAHEGGGMYSIFGSPTLTNVTFSSNSADFGGGMTNNSSSPTLTNVTFSANSSGNYGGGMLNDEGSSPTLTNVAFSGNSATTNAAGMLNVYSNPTLTNVTFSGNRAGAPGGAMLNSSSSPLIRNTIFWNNQDNSGVGTAAASIFNFSNSGTPSIPTISHSLVQGCYPGGLWTAVCGTNGGNNLPDADPLFVTTPNPADAPSTAGNLRLQIGSPAIDAGNDAVANAIDLDGTPRIQGVAVDLGPYEYGDATCTIPIVPTVTIELTGSPQTDVLLSWAADPANDGYKVYRSPQPYFDPAATTALVTLPAGTTSYTDPAVADPATPTYYTVRGVSNCGILSTWQTPLGQFAFVLTPGQ